VGVKSTHGEGIALIAKTSSWQAGKHKIFNRKGLVFALRLLEFAKYGGFNVEIECETNSYIH
jgi:hypothetical protein